jgi:hypothetical protein
MIKAAHLPLCAWDFFSFFQSAAAEAAARRLSFSALEQHLSAAPRGDEHCNFGLVCVISGRASIKMRRRRQNSAALRVHKRRVVLLFARLRPTLICIFLSLIIEGPKGPELTPPEVHTKADMIIGERLSNT